MRVLALDAGNSAFKIAVFEQEKIVGTFRIEQFNETVFSTFFSDHPADTGIWCSVRNDNERIGLILEKHLPVWRMDDKTPVPVKNNYESPATLGPDRLAGVTGAHTILPGSDVLVIGMGTTITYDLITGDRTYAGGSISPGLQMRFDALHHYTAKLPRLVADRDFNSENGTDTQTSILSGVQNGLLHEITGFIDSYINRFKGLKVILTGGDAALFATLLKKSIFAPSIQTEPNLVLIGLNTVFHYNDQNA